jgi:hypothetical protein
VAVAGAGWQQGSSWGRVAAYRWQQSSRVAAEQPGGSRVAGWQQSSRVAAEQPGGSSKVQLAASRWQQPGGSSWGGAGGSSWGEAGSGWQAGSSKQLVQGRVAAASS